MSVAAASAIAALRDPDVREQIVRAGSGVAQQVRRWNDERRADGSSPGAISVDSMPGDAAASRRVPVVIPAVEQRRLEKRAARLSDTVAQLRSATGPRVATTFDEMDVAISRVALTLSVAKNLPRRRRLEALDEVTTVLSGMENAVKDALLDGLRE